MANDMLELAKLFLNNLYGKTASNTDSSSKLAHIKEDKPIGFMTITAITSDVRNFIIRSTQKNYRGVNEHRFIYADTDSIHCSLASQADMLADDWFVKE